MKTNQGTPSVDWFSNLVKTKDADGKPLTLTRKVTAARWTFVIGKDGKIVSKNTKVNPVQDSKQIAELIEKLDRQ